MAWTCSAEFDANEHQSISFIDDEAYVMLAKPAVQTGERYTHHRDVDEEGFYFFLFL